MNKKIIRNARIITMNERLDILPNGNILIENGKISAITTQSLEDTCEVRKSQRKQITI